MRISRQAQVRDKVRAHRARLRRRGLRPVQFWVPDVRSPGFPAEALRQSGAVASGGHESNASWRAGEPISRGEIWLVAIGSGGARQAPAVVLQDDGFAGTTSVTICPFSERAVDAPLLRLPVAPPAGSGLPPRTHLMIDRIGTISKTRLRQRLGRLSGEDLVRMNRALLVFLGLAGRA